MRPNKIVCVVLMALCVLVAAGAEQRAATGNFVISIDRAAWEKWGFQYPVTYIFDVSPVEREARVNRRDRAMDAWSPLETRTAANFFNGIEYAANGWMYSYRYVADRARVTPGRP